MAGRLAFILLVLFSCSESHEPGGCYECITVTTITETPGQETTTTLKADRCDLDALEAVDLEQTGTFTTNETVNGVNVRTEQTVSCEIKPK